MTPRSSCSRGRAKSPAKLSPKCPEMLRPGVTERQYAVALERAMVDLGAEGPAFATIVASGPNGAIGHHVPTDRQFQTGDLVTVDCGAKVDGYHADMTRTVAIGEPAAWQREIYELVAAAQAARVAAAKVGADVAEVDSASRDLISEAGHGEYFTHGLGHGVGLLIHEAPWLAQNETGTPGPGAHHDRTRDLPARRGRRPDRGHARSPRRYRGGGIGSVAHHHHQGTAGPVGVSCGRGGFPRMQEK